MQLNIRVGASIDHSLSEAFRPLLKSAEQAKQALGQAARQTSQTQTRETKRQVDEQAKAIAKQAREQERAERDKVRAAERTAREQTRSEERAVREQLRLMHRKWLEEQRQRERSIRETERAERDKTRSAERENAARERSNLRASREADRIQRKWGRDGERAVGKDERRSWGVGRAVMGGAVGATAAVGRAGLRVAGDLARGAGVDLDFGNMVQQNVALESAATSLSNSGFIAGDARNGQRVSSRALMNQALQVGSETGFNANTAIEGLSSFVAKTGDLATGRELLKDMAVFAKATGASLDDMVNAAGDVSAQFGDMPNKAEIVKKTMAAIAGQGKLGAVEIKDLARQMAKIASVAGQIEGDIGDNIVTMGAFAQSARQRGGAASATQAATSAQALINTFKTPARAAAFKEATGKSAFNAQGMLRNPQELVMEALRARGMNPEGFKKIFANVAGARAVEGYATIYRQAGGGKAGEEAVQAEFDRMRQAALSSREAMDSFTAALNTTESQAESFNNEMRKSALSIKDTLTPALQAVAPLMLQAAKGFAEIVAGVATSLDPSKKGKTASAEFSSEMQALNARSVLRQLGRGGVIDDEDLQSKLEWARKSKSDLATSITGKKKDLLEEGKFEILGGGALAHMTPDKLEHWAKQDSAVGEKAAEYLRDKKQLESMEDTLSTLERAQSEIADKIADKTLRVVLVGDTRPGAPPEISSAGRDPTPEQKAARR